MPIGRSFGEAVEYGWPHPNAAAQDQGLDVAPFAHVARVGSCLREFIQKGSGGCMVKVGNTPFFQSATILPKGFDFPC